MRYLALLFGFCVLILQGGCDSKSGGVATRSAVIPGPMVSGLRDNQRMEFVEGVDLSKWQGTVDFLKIKNAGKHYVFIKTTLGQSEHDPEYAINIKNARAAGLLAGSYHFYETDDKPDAQFANLTRYLSLRTGDLPPVVDIEKLAHRDTTDAAVVASLKQFLRLLEQRYDVKPVIYSGESFANQYLSGFGQYPLWLAEYNKNKSPLIPAGWNTWTFWQYSQDGAVDGVAGPIDLNRFNGTLQDLAKLKVK